jgi:hypothetical protein
VARLKADGGPAARLEPKACRAVSSERRDDIPDTSQRIFDAGQGYGPLTDLLTLVDATVAKRANRWWMFADGFTKKLPEIHLFSASLPEGAPLSAAGWTVTSDPGDASRPALLAGKERSHWWDGLGGRHCPSYVKGFDPGQGTWVERIYYAGAVTDYTGPYSIGYLEWAGGKWVDQQAAAFTANEYWEHGSVYEPNLIYHDGKWKMWYVAGANHDDYLVQGYAESPDGRTGWSAHKIFIKPAEKVFDFCVTQGEQGYEAVFSRVDMGRGTSDPAETGLWWCEASRPSPDLSDWSKPIQISGAGPWKPCLRYGEASRSEMFVFHNNLYPNTCGFGMPTHFTINCLQARRPR